MASRDQLLATAIAARNSLVRRDRSGRRPALLASAVPDHFRDAAHEYGNDIGNLVCGEASDVRLDALCTAGPRALKNAFRKPCSMPGGAGF
ncbi:hypothetical protein J2792_004238 [Novosphingobium capsulatum]|uniref:Uncharacterized protein n=1 Tax=Novosphingobium capsulatum TaxID=13688 RepID=A0ABU1MSN7_9SPHN|nr:hypothetical protein [Novosphingobium capsulatum]